MFCKFESLSPQLDLMLPSCMTSLPQNAPLIDIPAVFTHGHPRCSGDLIVESWDHARFCIAKALLVASGGCFFDLQATEDPLPVPYPLSLPRIRLHEDAETVLALLQGFYPLPSAPITSLELGLKCLVAADKYGLSPSLFRVDYHLFANVPMMADPFGVCVLAWCTGEWALVQHACRFTHDLSVPELVARALDLPNGGEVLAALLATRAQKQMATLDVVRVLPDRLVCLTCRTHRPQVWAPMAQAVAALFDTPFPNLGQLFHNPLSALQPHLQLCLTGGCHEGALSIEYTTEERQAIEQAFENVPQTIENWIIQQKATRLQMELAARWR